MDRSPWPHFILRIFYWLWTPGIINNFIFQPSTSLIIYVFSNYCLQIKQLNFDLICLYLDLIICIWDQQTDTLNILPGDFFSQIQKFISSISFLLLQIVMPLLNAAQISSLLFQSPLTAGLTTKSFLITICSFSGPGLFTQLVTLRDEVIAPGGQGAGLLTTCSKRGGFPTLSVSQLHLKPTAWIAVNWATSHYPNSTPGKENWSKYADAHATCSAMNNRVLYLSLGNVAYCQLSWNINRLTYEFVSRKKLNPSSGSLHLQKAISVYF